MQGSEFEEEGLFRNIAKSGVRALLFGRRALIALGLPVATFDYDFWIAIDEAARPLVLACLEGVARLPVEMQRSVAEHIAKLSAKGRA